VRLTFDTLLPWLIFRLRYLWLCLLTGLALAAALIVFHHPKLQLPDSKEFQLFSSHHLFERWGVGPLFFWTHSDWHFVVLGFIGLLNSRT